MSDHNDPHSTALNLDPSRQPNPIISIDRLVFLMLITFGFYAFVWLYRNWKQFRGVIWEETMLPGLRTLGVFVPILGLILIYKQFKNINQYLQSNGMPGPYYSPGLLAFGFYLILGLHRFTERLETLDIGVPITVLTFVYTLIILLLEIIPIMAFQNTLNVWWQQEGHPIPRQYRMDRVELSMAIFGSLLWIFSLMDLFSGLFVTESVF